MQSLTAVVESAFNIVSAPQPQQCQCSIKLVVLCTAAVSLHLTRNARTQARDAHSLGIRTHGISATIPRRLLHKLAKVTGCLRHAAKLPEQCTKRVAILMVEACEWRVVLATRRLSSWVGQ